MQPTTTPTLFRPKQKTVASKIVIALLFFASLFWGGSSNGFTLTTQAANWPEQTIQIPTLQMPTVGVNFNCEASVQMSSNECNALLSLYKNTVGATWQTNTNWLITPNPCKWYGIMCDQEGSVLSIDLGDNGLIGTLPDELGNLKNLRMLGLWGNQISGSIPKTIGNLTELGILDVSRNSLTGIIPHEIGNLFKLNTLWLSENRLSGVVPSSLAGLENLVSLHIERNTLSGAMPSAIFDLPKNEEFEFSYNAIEIEAVVSRSSANAHSLQTQTLPPKGLSASLSAEDLVMLTWTPIEYQDDNGFYEISYRTDDEETYTVHSKTATDVDRAKIDGLSPGSTYHFVVRTYTPPHLLQTNAMWSTYSDPVSQTTAAQAVPIAEPTPLPASDLTITAVEVTQGLQNLTNDMPLIADRLTWARVYAKSDLHNIEGVSAQLRAFRDGSELIGSPLAMKYAPITVRTDGGSRLNMDDNFQFDLPTSWLTGTVTFHAELNHDLHVKESVQSNNRWEESATFHPSDPLSLVMVSIELHKDGDSSQPAQTYKTDNPGFDAVIANSYRYMPVSTIEWREHTETLAPDCEGICNIESYTDPGIILEQLELMRTQEEEVSRFYETSTSEHWVGMVDPRFFFGGLGIRPQKSYWLNYSAWSSISSTYPATHASPYEVGGSLAMMHEIGHNLGMMHVDCQAGEPNTAASYPFGATESSECSLDEINESGFYGFDVYYQAAGLEKPAIISNDPAAGKNHAAYPMMSYKFPGWPSSYKYCQLLIKFNVPCTIYNYDDEAVAGSNEEPTSIIDLGDTQLLTEMRLREGNGIHGETESEKFVTSDENLILPKNQVNQTTSAEQKNTLTKRIIDVEPTTGESSLEVVNIQDAEHGYATSNGQILYYISQEENLHHEMIVYTLRDQDNAIIKQTFEIGETLPLEAPSIMLPLIMNH